MQSRTGSSIGLVILLAAAVIGGVLVGRNGQAAPSPMVIVTAIPDIRATVNAGMSATTTAQRQAPPQAGADRVSSVPPVSAPDPSVAPTVQQVRPTPTVPPPTLQVTETPTIAPQVASYDRDLGVCPACTPPQMIGPHQVALVHGDINTSGTCHYRVYTTGQTVPRLGTGQYRVKLIQGSQDYIDQRIESDTAGAGASAGGSCTKL
ncbi:MAG: hypothetical protein ACR2MQ_06860 [Gemmatimonadaceae bacterium]